MRVYGCGLPNKEIMIDIKNMVLYRTSLLYRKSLNIVSISACEHRSLKIYVSRK